MRKKSSQERLPIEHVPTLKVITRPNDANLSGDIFGGWLMSQMDIAGAIVARERAKGPVVTVAVKNLLLMKPIFVQDVVIFYTEITRVGTTSITVDMEVFTQRLKNQKVQIDKVSTGTFVYVAVVKPGKKRKVTG